MHWAAQPGRLRRVPIWAQSAFVAVTVWEVGNGGAPPEELLNILYTQDSRPKQQKSYLLQRISNVKVKNPGLWWCLYILFCVLCVCAKSLQSCLTLCNPMDRSLPGSSVCGLPCPPPADLPQRILFWVRCKHKHLTISALGQNHHPSSTRHI